MRRAALVFAASISLVVPLTVAAAQAKPKVTLIGDSVADRMERNPAALASLNDGFRINLQTRACRSLAGPSCTVAGEPGPPPTVLDVVNRFRKYLGQIVVVEDGYNDLPGRFQHDFNTILGALQSAHVKTVVWLTLRDPKGAYVGMNNIIRGARKRWPQLVVADWNTYSAAHPDWFYPDDGFGGIHPTPLGAANLGRFIHAELVAVTHHRS